MLAASARLQTSLSSAAVSGRTSYVRYFTRLADQPCALAYEVLLKECASSRDLHQGMRIHSHIIQDDIERTELLGNNMLHMYVECGALLDAQKLFHEMHPSNRFTWNVMIRSYIQNGQSRQALDLFLQMDKQGVIPDTYIFVSVLPVCVHIVDGMKLHADIVRIGIEANVIIVTTLISMYGKHGHVNDALMLFHTMREPNIVSWNTIISAQAKCGQVQLARRLYLGMQEEGFLPDRVTFVSILCACAQHLFLRDGQQLHSIISFKGVNKDIVVYTALVDMYGKCGRVLDAQDIFLNMDERNTVSWTALISAYAQDGDVRKSCQLYMQMHQEGILADKVTFLTLFDILAHESVLVEGKRTHASIAGTSLESDIVVATSLLNMYGKCGDLQWSRRIFDMLPEPNEYSWNSMVAVYIQKGHIHEALQLFGQMDEKGQTPHELAIVNGLHTCAHQGAEEEGKGLHSYIIMNCLESDTVHAALVDMYGKFGSLHDALHTFDFLYEPAVAVWNAIIAVQLSSGNQQRACQSFDQIHQEGLIPDRETFSTMTSVLSQTASDFVGKQMIARIYFCGFMSAALVNLYGNRYNLRDAYRIFDVLPSQDVFVWNAIIQAAIENGHIVGAFQLLHQMMWEEGIAPDKVTYTSILSACGHSAGVDDGSVFQRR